MKKKYLLCPGYITSFNDGERHYISAGKLIGLYRVNPAECILYDNKQPEKLKGLNLISLHPRHSGVYEIPKQPSDV